MVLSCISNGELVVEVVSSINQKIINSNTYVNTNDLVSLLYFIVKDVRWCRQLNESIRTMKQSKYVKCFVATKSKVWCTISFAIDQTLKVVISERAKFLEWYLSKERYDTIDLS